MKICWWCHLDRDRIKRCPLFSAKVPAIQGHASLFSFFNHVRLCESDSRSGVDGQAIKVVRTSGINQIKHFHDVITISRNDNFNERIIAEISSIDRETVPCCVK